MKKEFYGKALQLTDDAYSVCCVVQEGTGNTKETSNLCERFFPYSIMKHFIEVSDDYYVAQPCYFKITITEGLGSITYDIVKVSDKDAELNNLFKKPDYFDGSGIDFLNDRGFLDGKTTISFDIPPFKIND